jgi:hypothetical protein
VLDKEFIDDFPFVVLRNVGIHCSGNLFRYYLKVFEKERYPAAGARSQQQASGALQIRIPTERKYSADVFTSVDKAVMLD